MVTVSTMTSKSLRTLRTSWKIFCSNSQITLWRHCTQRRNTGLFQSTLEGWVRPVSALIRADRRIGYDRAGLIAECLHFIVRSFHGRIMLLQGRGADTAGKTR